MHNNLLFYLSQFKKNWKKNYLQKLTLSVMNFLKLKIYITTTNSKKMNKKKIQPNNKKKMKMTPIT